MKKKTNISTLFNQSGNLTIEAIERYLAGMLDKDEMEIVRKHLEVSPFDREAIEGIQRHGLKDISGDVNLLNNKIQKSVKITEKAENNRISVKAYWYAAAGIILLAGLSMMLLFLTDYLPIHNRLAVNTPSTVNEEATIEAQPSIESPVIQPDTLPDSMQNTNIIEPVMTRPETKKVTIIDNDAVVDEQFIVENIEDAEVAAEQEIPAMEIMEEESAAEEVEIFMVVEQMPEFPGGEDSLNIFLVQNITYPQSARDNNIQGRVFVTFCIEKDGTVSDARILRGIGGGCDEEALRVINLMPGWIPGRQRGQPVRVQYNMPIKFTLSN